MTSNENYGFLELIEPIYKMDGKRKRKYWKCWCKHCHNFCEVREDNIKSGQRSCGCLSRSTYARNMWQRGNL